MIFTDAAHQMKYGAASDEFPAHIPFMLHVLSLDGVRSVNEYVSPRSVLNESHME
jgi:hypothetical protein